MAAAALHEPERRSCGADVNVEDLLGPTGRRPALASVDSSARLVDMERDHIRRILDETEGRIDGPDGAAERLDINPSTLRSRMRKLGLARK